MKRILALMLFAIPSFSEAGTSPLGLSILPPVQFPGQKSSVVGLRASALWGKHENSYGIDVGVVGNITEDQFVGTGVSGVFNSANHATILGAQLAGVANVSQRSLFVFGIQAAGVINLNQGNTRIIGLQLAGITNTTRQKKSKLIGLQVAGVSNNAHSTYVYGIQLSPFNSCWQLAGFQLGVFNDAREVYGVQIGLINRAQKLHGLQIGLLNIVGDSDLKVFPILRVGF